MLEGYFESNEEKFNFRNVDRQKIDSHPRRDIMFIRYRHMSVMYKIT